MKKLILLTIFSFLLFGCNINPSKEERIQKLETEIESLKKIRTESPSELKGQIATFLTFQENNAEEAMNFYVELFGNSKIINLKRWSKEGPGKEGTIMHATFKLNGKLFMCSNSPAIHKWGFTPAVSNYVECVNKNELNKLFEKLSANGKVMMPLDNYGFSQEFGFVEDRFGVSWQLNLK